MARIYLGALGALLLFCASAHAQIFSGANGDVGTAGAPGHLGLFVQPLPGTFPGSGGAPSVTSPPSGTANDDGLSTLGTSSTPVVSALSANQSRKALYITLNTSGATVWCNPYGGTAVAGDAHDIQVNQYLNFAAIGFIPNGAVNCISSVANTVLAVYEAH